MTSAPPAGRLIALDGLRGVAALVVVAYHASKIVVPELDGTGATVYRAIADSPLKLAFAGTEAVLVFFVLSGLVVAIPAFRPGFAWRAYLGSRLVRLYLPVWAALLLAAALIVLLPREAGAASPGGWLARTNASTLSWGSLLGEASLWQGTYRIDNVLWSLRWELVFSLALPLFVGGAVLVRRRGWLWPTLAVCVAVSVAGRLSGVDALVYLPVFFAGTALASRITDVREWGARRSRRFWVFAGSASALLLIAGWLLRPVVAPGTSVGLVLWGLVSAGAVGLVMTAVGSVGAARALALRVPRWLGRVSFSLYLVHVPVLASLGFLWGQDAWPWVLAVGVPASLMLAEVFTRLVERPSHRLARVLRRRLSRADAQRPAVLPTSAR